MTPWEKNSLGGGRKIRPNRTTSWAPDSQSAIHKTDAAFKIELYSVSITKTTVVEAGSLDFTVTGYKPFLLSFPSQT